MVEFKTIALPFFTFFAAVFVVSAAGVILLVSVAGVEAVLSLLSELHDVYENVMTEQYTNNIEPNNNPDNFLFIQLNFILEI